jgi:hypothetical protein
MSYWHAHHGDVVKVVSIMTKWIVQFNGNKLQTNKGSRDEESADAVNVDRAWVKHDEERKDKNLSGDRDNYDVRTRTVCQYGIEVWSQNGNAQREKR